MVLAVLLPSKVLNTEGFSESPGKVFSCLLLSVSTAAIPKAHQCPLRSLKYPFVINARDTWGIWASYNGVLLPVLPSQAHFSFQHPQLLRIQSLKKQRLETVSDPRHPGGIEYQCQLKPCILVGLICQVIGSTWFQ